ncbi:protein seele [Tribolium madens]|uniref:protein seele n=1 Tax=Tribolium madens TaxID=41895 RepID=UPI001CF76511|nr:protein seele [Tribolium madens]
MKIVLVLVTLFCYHTGEAQKIDAQELRCLVCKTSLDELHKAVNKIDPTKTVDVGGYRLDSDGNYRHKSVSQAKSEVHLSEMIEDICTKMDDYVRATWKSNGTLTLLKLITEDGKMNNDMSEVNLVQDDDLNKSLKYYCEGIMEELEENIIKHFQSDTKDIHKKVCVEESAICGKKVNEEL